MAVRFDDDARSLRLSIADLLEREVRGSLGFALRGGFERMWLGQAIHSAYQTRALEEDATYRREIWLDLPLDLHGWEVHLVGRVDGVRRENGVLIIEEIKSVRRSGQLAPLLREAYERQASIYAWMLGRLESAPVAVELVLVEIGSEAVDRLRLEVATDAVEAGVRRRLGHLLHEHESERHRRDQRRAAADRMLFPYASPRPGQLEIIERVESALTEREHVLVEAATGLGKTVAALYPALRFAQRHDKRIFVLTAKNLQQEMAGHVLRLLNPDRAFHSLRLRAKARMCANHEVLCHEEYCPYARDYFPKLRSSGVVPQLLETHADLLPDDVFAAAKAAEVCPFEVSLEIAREVQAIVCDYNYVFDPYVALTEFQAGNDLSDVILIIDEAHNLVDRGRGYLSPELGEELVRRVLADRGSGSPALRARMHRLAARLGDLLVETATASLPDGPADAAAEITLPELELHAFRPAFDETFVAHLEERRETRSFRAEDPFVELYFDLVRFLEVARAADSASFSLLAKRTRGASSLKILCRDASRFLGQVIQRTHSTIALSATLQPPDFYLELLGFDRARSSSLSLGSPFPPENRRIVVDTGVTTLWRRREENYPVIAERLADLVREVPGNCLVLFPSYAFLEEIAARLPRLAHQVLVQRQTDDGEAREALLDRLRGSLFSRVLLLSVAGGVFAEGVDYPGDMLQAVVVVGPCLPAVGLEQRLLQEHYEERFEKGFEYAYVVPGMTRVIQAAGRLIRSAGDRGVIALLDRRFLDSPYVDHLPTDWIPEGGPRALAGNPAEVARLFFGG
ncbi:MAG TPA: helicase C-terminal domain-containing protein [Thermoanaerobaculia bacterium]|nr:helicase C-terminal domain-containing protein [Thermoanaerobaculia bacterium]